MSERTIHCLWCRHPLEEPVRASNACGGCGRVNLREDLRIFRTKRPAPRVAEALLKGLAGLALGGLYLLCIGPAMGMGAGYAIGLVLLCALIAWDALGLITRRESVLRYKVFVPGLFAGCLAPVLMWLFVYVCTSGLPRRGYAVVLVLALVCGVGWYLRYGTSRRRPKPRRRAGRDAADSARP